MANHDVWDAIEAADGTPANSFEFLLDLYFGGSFVTFADVTNVNPAFTDKNRVRQTYAAKGVDRSSKYGSNLVLTWDHEAVRDANGQFQPELQDLINAAKSNGVANRRRLRAYDALGADYAFDGWFSIQVTRTNSGWDDAGFFTITASQYEFLGWIENPVLTGLVPLIGGANPSGAAVGDSVYIQGENFTGATGVAAVKFGGTNAASYEVVSDSLIVAEVPAGSAGSAPIVVTTPSGASSEFPYTRGA